MKSEIPEKGKRIKATLKTNKSKWLFGYYDEEQFVAFLDWTSMIEGKPTFYKWSDVEQWVYVKKSKANTTYVYFHCACYISSNNLFKILSFAYKDIK